MGCGSVACRIEFVGLVWGKDDIAKNGTANAQTKNSIHNEHVYIQKKYLSATIREAGDALALCQGVLEGTNVNVISWLLGQRRNPTGAVVVQGDFPTSNS